MALKDSRPDVRGLAASELAEIKDTASVPLIVAALRKEEHLMPKFNMAAALILLNSKVGNDVLSRICRDESVEEGVRLSAASRLFDVDDLNCLDSVENILIMAKDDSIKQSALLFLASIKNPPAPLTPRLHTALIVSLQDPTPVIRECASRAIAGLADKAAVPNLRVAIVNESDQLTKEQMEDSLRMLQGK